MYVGHLPLNRRKDTLTKEPFINNYSKKIIIVRKGLTDESARMFIKNTHKEQVERLEKAKHRTGKCTAGVTWGK